MIIKSKKISIMRTAFIETRNCKFYVNDGLGYVWAETPDGKVGQPFTSKKSANIAFNNIPGVR